MAIDRVKKATFLVPHKEVNRLINTLHGLSAVHVEDAGKLLAPPEDADLKKTTSANEEADSNLKKLEIIKSTFNLFIKEKKGFIEGFASMPLQVTKSELREVVSEFDFNPLYNECAYIYDEYRSLQNQIEQSQTERALLVEFLGLPFTIKRALSLAHVTVAYGTFRGRNWTEFTSDTEAQELLAWDVIRSDGKVSVVTVAFLNEDAEAARGLLRKFGFAETALPRLPGEVEDRINELDEDIKEREEQQQEYKTRVIELAKDSRKVDIAHGYWDSERRKTEAHNSILKSQRMAIITGWVRVKDLDRLQPVLDSSFPEVSTILEDPVETDDVPVSITPGWFAAPAQTLVNMFGLPTYFSFDPTPYLLFSYILFFSFCFGDVIYGLGLTALSFMLARKYSTYGPQRKFFRLFLYAGIGTMIFGALTGTWAGDLPNPQYLGGNNFLLKARQSIPYINPLEKVVVMLLATLAIGVLNQFYGITLGIYKAFRKRNWADGIFDAGLWLVFLPGVLLLLAPMFMPDAPGWLATLAYWLTGVGGIGLVLTQGRKEEGIAAKAITGVVSLYGVLGTYGFTSFLGDTLSYMRLLALGLTTTIVAMSFNIIADLVGGAGGIVAFAIVAILGHSFNFGVSILSAFVHSARLIFLEFFNRFYEGGARRFVPLSLNGDQIEVLEH